MQHSAITSDRDYDRVERAIRFIADNRLEQPSLEEVADAMGVSPFHAQRVFSSWAGVSPKRFLGLLTVEHAKSLLRADESVLGAAYEVGLSGGSRLHDLFVGFEAITPGEYKSMGAGSRAALGCPRDAVRPRPVRRQRARPRPPRPSSTAGISTMRWPRPGPTGRSAGSSRMPRPPAASLPRRSAHARKRHRCACSPRARRSRSRSGAR